MICTKKKYLYKKVKQNGIPAALALILVLTMTGCTSAKTPELKDAIHKTAAYEQETVTDPAVGSLGGEWTVIALARSEENVDSNYFEKYRANVEKYLKEQDGILSENKYTEYSRVILALNAIGEDASDIGGYDLKEKLDDFDTVTAQGLNGAVFALLALNADSEETDGELQQKYLNYILKQEKTDGGFSMDDNADEADIDITAMTLQCLEAYSSEENVQQTIDRGIEFLADAQDADGGYTVYGEKSSESVSQTMIALSTVGIDCNKDERFQKDGKGLYDILMKYYQKDGSFSHTQDGESDPMATDQALCALVSYERLQDEKNTFYDMTDHR